MNWLPKLPGQQRAPAGLELRLLRLMPTVWLAGTMLPALMAFAARYLLTGNTASELAHNIQMFDYAMIGLAILNWILVLTVTIGCIIVWLMRGPTRVADGFGASDGGRPRR